MIDNEFVICDISALQWHRCPPSLLEIDVPREQACAPVSEGGAGLPADLFHLRANAREADAMVSRRLLTDLKGITPPVHIMVEANASRRNNNLVISHRMPPYLTDEDVLPIGGGLSVLSPTATLAHLSRRLTLVELLLMMFEFAGTYRIHHETTLTRFVLNRLLADGLLSKAKQEALPDHVREYRDVQGRRVPMVDRMGRPLPWELAFDRLGKPTELWRCPPLVDSEEIQLFAGTHAGFPGAKRFLEAANTVQGGSASPLETKTLLMLCLDSWRGGEGWPWPHLNQRIDLTEEAKLLYSKEYCIADELWDSSHAILEINGEAFHADRDGFKLESGRTPALESMGYAVQEITHSQLSNLDIFDAAIQTIADRFGFPLRARSASFLKRRASLHQELFGATSNL